MEKTARVIFVYWTPVVLWMVIIFYLSSRTSITVSPEYLLNFLFFKTLHLIEYALLFTLTTRAVNQSGVRNNAFVYKTAFIVTILYAMTDELHQQFVPTREGKSRDVIIDGIGAGLVWYYLSTKLPKAPQKLKSWVRNWDIPF